MIQRCAASATAVAGGVRRSRPRPRSILRRYSDYSPAERDDAIATLAARPAWAQALLEALGRGQIPRRDVSVSIARQLLAFGDPAVERPAREGLGHGPADLESQGAA